uniref:Uncharacterized protein n=1 Tax=Avena sativa TaxID=4498 RepID=A0ACD5VFV8_AVESA
MHVLWLLAARRFRRRAVSTITASATAPATPCGGYGEDDGPFFDLDLSCCSAPASSAGSSSESEDSSSSCAGGEVDFVISLQRSCSASPSYERLSFGRCGWGALPPQMKFCASEPNDPAAAARFSASGRRAKLRTLSFGSAKAAFYGGRASFSRSTNSARSARVFAAYGGHGSPDQDQEEGPNSKKADVIRRCLSKISRRLRRVAPGPAAADLRLRKSRSASAAQTAAARAHSSSPSRRDDSLLEKQDGIASAIAHCKESIHRASMSECDSSLLRSWS